MSTQNKCLEELCAMKYSRRNWHTLTSVDKEIVSRLEKGGFLTAAKDGQCGHIPAKAEGIL